MVFPARLQVLIARHVSRSVHNEGRDHLHRQILVRPPENHFIYYPTRPIEVLPRCRDVCTARAVLGGMPFDCRPMEATLAVSVNMAHRPPVLGSEPERTETRCILQSSTHLTSFRASVLLSFQSYRLADDDSQTSKL